MRINLSALALIGMFWAASASAQCYISPDARGSAPGARTKDGTLCRFGDDVGMVEPQYGYQYQDQNPYENLYSPQEYARMVKQMYRKYQRGISNGDFQRALTQNAQPLRPAGR